MKKTQRTWKRSVLMALGLALAAGAGHALVAPTAPQCFEVDNGAGTVTLPPANCSYMTAADVHKVINGLPAGTEIILAPIHKDFICKTGGPCGTPGGTLGGEVETFSSNVIFQAVGTGALAGWSRLITIPMAVQTHTGPRTPGNPVQSFSTNMHLLQGQLPPGDPDFSVFKIVGGTGNGFPSPGHTTLTKQTNGTWLVDSSFTITFEVEFVGAPGGIFSGLSGKTVRRVGMKAYK